MLRPITLATITLALWGCTQSSTTKPRAEFATLRQALETCPNSSSASDDVLCTSDDCDAVNVRTHGTDECASGTAPEHFGVLGESRVELGSNVTIESHIGVIDPLATGATEMPLVIGAGSAVSTSSGTSWQLVADGIELQAGGSFGQIAASQIVEHGATYAVVTKVPNPVAKFPDLGEMGNGPGDLVEIHGDTTAWCPEDVVDQPTVRLDPNATLTLHGTGTGRCGGEWDGKETPPTVYKLGKLELQDGSRIRFEGPALLLVSSTITSGDTDQVFIEPASSSVTAADIFLAATGKDATGPGPYVLLGADSHITGMILSNGGLELKDGAQVHGTLYGREVKVGNDAHLWQEGGLFERPSTNPCEDPSLDNGGCGPNANCYPASGGTTTCDCHAGYLLRDGECREIDCVNVSTCGANTVCELTSAEPPHSNTCSCLPHYEGNPYDSGCTGIPPAKCSDYNPCLANRAECTDGVDFGDPVTCTCKPGFTGDGMTYCDVDVPACDPVFDEFDPVLTHPMVPAEALTEFWPLGWMARGSGPVNETPGIGAPNHVLPTDHIYPHIDGWQVLSSPATARITDVFGKPDDAAISLTVCREYQITFGHVKLVHSDDPTSPGLYELMTSRCPDPTKDCQISDLSLAVAGGAPLAAVYNGFDFNATDDRMPAPAYINPAADYPGAERLAGYNPPMNRKKCGMHNWGHDYWTNTLEAKSIRDEDSTCGSIMQDLPETPQGRWFPADRESIVVNQGMYNGKLTLGHWDVRNFMDPSEAVPQLGVISVDDGQNVFPSTMLPESRVYADMFEVARSDPDEDGVFELDATTRINRDFSLINDGQIYCYKTYAYNLLPHPSPEFEGYARVFLVQLERPESCTLPSACSEDRLPSRHGACDATSYCDRLKLQYRPDMGTSCGDPSTWAFDTDGVGLNDTPIPRVATYQRGELREPCPEGPGYTRSAPGAACVDINECATNNGGCAAHATCTNTAGSSTCACDAGYLGDGKTCVLDECATDNGGCHADATCAMGPSGRTCACKPGFSGDGIIDCGDVNECATSNGGCSANADCTNTTGSRSCTCHGGYTGDGVTCTDVNECATNHGGCSANADCTNTSGSHSCTCKSGFGGDGISCTDINECADNNGGCSTNANCTNTSGSRSCACKSGFTGDGVTCTDIDECSVDDGGCSAHATCTNTAGSHSCACNDGFMGDGVTCITADMLMYAGQKTGRVIIEPEQRGYTGFGRTYLDALSGTSGNYHGSYALSGPALLACPPQPVRIRAFIDVLNTGAIERGADPVGYGYVGCDGSGAVSIDPITLLDPAAINPSEPPEANVAMVIPTLGPPSYDEQTVGTAIALVEGSRGVEFFRVQASCEDPIAGSSVHNVTVRASEEVAFAIFRDLPVGADCQFRAFGVVGGTEYPGDSIVDYSVYGHFWMLTGMGGGSDMLTNQDHVPVVHGNINLEGDDRSVGEMFVIWGYKEEPSWWVAERLTWTVPETLPSVLTVGYQIPTYQRHFGNLLVLVDRDQNGELGPTDPITEFNGHTPIGFRTARWGPAWYNPAAPDINVSADSVIDRGFLRATWDGTETKSWHLLSVAGNSALPVRVSVVSQGEDENSLVSLPERHDLSLGEAFPPAFQLETEDYSGTVGLEVCADSPAGPTATCSARTVTFSDQTPMFVSNVHVSVISNADDQAIIFGWDTPSTMPASYEYRVTIRDPASGEALFSRPVPGSGTNSIDGLYLNILPMLAEEHAGEDLALEVTIVDLNGDEFTTIPPDIAAPMNPQLFHVPESAVGAMQSAMMFAAFDVDECAVDNGGCDAVATCTNTLGAYRCTCPEGSFGDGFTCSDTDPCAVDNGGCDAGTVCENTSEGPQCVCPAGYSGTPETACVDVDECAGENECDPNSACHNTEGAYTCSCNDGYHGDGSICLPDVPALGEVVVAYSGSKVGRVFVEPEARWYGGFGRTYLDRLSGTSGNYAGTLALSGPILEQCPMSPVPIRAFIDVLNSGALVPGADPVGSGTVECVDGVLSIQPIVLEDPAPVTPGDPALDAEVLFVFPAPGVNTSTAPGAVAVIGGSEILDHIRIHSSCTDTNGTFTDDVTVRAAEEIEVALFRDLPGDSDCEFTAYGIVDGTEYGSANTFEMHLDAAWPTVEHPHAAGDILLQGDDRSVGELFAILGWSEDAATWNVQRVTWPVASPLPSVQTVGYAFDFGTNAYLNLMVLIDRDQDGEVDPTDAFTEMNDYSNLGILNVDGRRLPDLTVATEGAVAHGSVRSTYDGTDTSTVAALTVVGNSQLPVRVSVVGQGPDQESVTLFPIRQDLALDRTFAPSYSIGFGPDSGTIGLEICFDNPSGSPLSTCTVEPVNFSTQTAAFATNVSATVDTEDSNNVTFSWELPVDLPAAYETEIELRTLTGEYLAYLVVPAGVESITTSLFTEFLSEAMDGRSGQYIEFDVTIHSVNGDQFTRTADWTLAPELNPQMLLVP